MPSWTLIKELGASFCFICCQCLVSYCDRVFLGFFVFLSNHQFAVRNWWGDRGVLCLRTSRMVVAAQELRRCCSCSCKPSLARAKHRGGRREGGRNPGYLRIHPAPSYATADRNQTSLRERELNYWVDSSTAGEWKRHLQICVSRPSNKYSVERRNLS